MMSIDRTDQSGEFGHLGWAYRDHDEFLYRAAEYLAIGLDLGQRICYVGEGDPARLRAALAAAGLGGDAGDVDIRSVAEHFVFRAGGDAVDADVMSERYAAAAIRAVADGYNGFRVVVDATPVARTPAQQEAQAALEILGERRIAALPVAAMCGYDVAALGVAAAGLLCLHPAAGPESGPFRLHIQPAEHDAILLAGDIDAASESVFTTALQRLMPLLSHDIMEIDARGLEFVGHRQLCLLDRYCAAHNRVALLRSDQPVVHRLVGLLGLDNVRAGAAA